MHKVEWEAVGRDILNLVVGLLVLAGLLIFLGVMCHLVGLAFLWGWRLLG